MRSFDFEKPVDENKDGVFNLCIISTDSTGAKIQRVVTVAVSDMEETDTNNGQGSTGGNSPGSGNGQAAPSQTGYLEQIQTKVNQFSVRYLAQLVLQDW